MKNKIIKLDEFQNIRYNLKKGNTKVVLCHGVYDLVHYGHIEHLKEAKRLVDSEPRGGGILVVSITSSKYVNKGPGRPYFSDEQRLEFMASLEVVDYVVLSESETANKVISIIQPDIYVKGQDYSVYDNDITSNIENEVNEVRKYGGDIHFTKGQIFSSTKLINNFLNVMPKEILELFRRIKKEYDINYIKSVIDSFLDINILVVGDIIIDEYVFCEVQGISSKDRALSSRYSETKTYAGGALAIARHLAEFSNNVTVCSILGNDHLLNHQILNQLNEKIFLDLVYDKNFKTVVKQRFLEKHSIREQYDKLFSINYLPLDSNLASVDRTKFYSKLIDSLPNYDIVVVCDYGHGVIDKEAQSVLEKNSKYLALNCQTNSSNYGNNIITKYNRADTFVIDEREAKLAYHSQYEERNRLLRNSLIKIREHLNSKIGWLTVGAEGAISIDNNNNIIKLPAFTLNVIDTIGAGDAFYALASLCALKNLPLSIGTMIGNLAGAIKVHNIGNSKPIDKISLLKFASTLLNV